MKTMLTVAVGAVLILGTAGSAVTIDTVPVSDMGNGPDSTGYGAVAYQYNIGTYEVTAGQYCALLNAVAGVDTHGLYNPGMWSYVYGCKIERYAGSGTSGDPYQYRVAGDWANRPVNYVSFWDACRFANWLHNGQPTGAQGLATTEDGAYFLNGVTSPTSTSITRETDWIWAVTSEDEWYKAAYYKGGGTSAGYFLYPTSSNSVPSNVLGDPSDPGNNATFEDSGYTIGSPYYLTEVGGHENSDSPYGTFDQGGNVSEWNEAIISTSYPGFRGGSFDEYEVMLRASTRGISSPGSEVGGLGFRVSEVPEPGCLAILVLGAVGMFLRRRDVRR
ncbi:MAG: SUMF1/EgtB/PvdO family nonheme iron enzyme [Phycisphaerae bacterium]|nr:SUMF1/EgtB/PvdO family nonheme iron enzyme [Phycisphaerae bacterium]